MGAIQYTKQRVLILAPHADDEIIGCGGVIQKYLKNNSIVRIVIASFVKGKSQKYDTETNKYVIYNGNVRLKELNQSHAILGIKDYCFLYTDYEAEQYHSRLDVIPRVELASKIEQEIKYFHPTVIYIPSKTKHQDHTALHQAALTATRPYYWNGSVIVYETDGEICFQPHLYIPMSSVEAEKKADALNVYKTQLGTKRHPINPESILTKAKFRGQSIYSDYAEAFQIIRLHG
ncbi:GlcNAc-PI de-N-acetylase [Polycladomyces abyssicola]|uniref:GlcNAc-PI de-N-acetylase n=1 Tax=Polycladomyces abyssicola TaxID=1125966 RepID=A0A8D5UFW9_9BACL|nr:PIG-L family deacetylase [Polycladomyces abyssicola]BCU81235.1 GlcNAc-PI de-N-acetylase [Polycladomyces abyssicola]